jgi:ABC-2 type transport system permease protein
MRTWLDLLRADFQMMVRNRQALFWTFFFPVLLMGLMGVVFGQENAFTMNLQIVNQDGTPAAQLVITTFEHVPGVKTTVTADRRQALDALKEGDYAAVLVLPPGMADSFSKGSLALPFYYDNSNMIQSSTVQSLVQQVLTEISYRATNTRPAFTLQSRGIAALGFDYIDFLVPGIVAMSLMTNGIYAVSGTFVSYRERGVLRRLKATPLPLTSFISARVLMHLVTALIQAGLVIAVGVLLFNVHIASGPTLLKVGILALIGSSSFVTIGFFVAAVSKNVEIAAALGNVIATPMMFLSGIFFPMENAPTWIQPIVKAMPLTYLANALRDVIIKGATLWFVRWDIVVLLVTATLFMTLSVRMFRWE